MNKSGRDGIITYHEGAMSIEIYWERSGSPLYDICLATIDLREWKNPKGVKIDKEHQLEILRNLRQWLKDQNIKSNIDLHSEIETIDRRCAWRKCDQRRIKGSAYCPYHYDYNLLRE